MQTQFNRRTATKVKNGRVQKKNRHTFSGHIACTIDRVSPGRGFRHVMTKRDILDFIAIIPNWESVGQRLEGIILDSPADHDGCHAFYHREESGMIYLHAWNEDLWVQLSRPYFDAHHDIFLRIAVSHDMLKDEVVCRFTEAQARAFMLLHVFMHELGHHWDRITQKHHGKGRGEDFAERFANRHLDLMYPDYVRVFGDPARGDL
jgi:hypothetical protein